MSGTPYRSTPVFDNQTLPAALRKEYRSRKGVWAQFLGNEWDLPCVPGLTVSGRVIYTGSQYIDTTWPRRSLPEWTRFDPGVRYPFDNLGVKGKLLVARLNVENVFDADYWRGGNSASARQGPLLMLLVRGRSQPCSKARAFLLPGDYIQHRWQRLRPELLPISRAPAWRSK